MFSFTTLTKKILIGIFVLTLFLVTLIGLEMLGVTHLQERLLLPSSEENDSIQTTEYLIRGVPYKSVFVGTPLTTTAGMITHSIAEYYREGWVNSNEIEFVFPYNVNGENTIDITTIQKFFEKFGYETKVISTTDPEDIKKYLRQDIPVIIEQRLSLDSPTFVQTLRLAIGFSDEEQAFVFHDNNFGNNFSINYDEYAILNLETNQKGLVILPRQDFVNNATEAYPERLSIMDDPDIRKVQIAWVTADALGSQINPYISAEQRRELYTQIAQQWELIVFGPGFEKLHPAGRYVSSFILGRIYTNELDKHNEAQTVFRDVTNPQTVQHDFKKAFGGWQRQNPEVYNDPWWKTAGLVGLGVASIRMEDFETATKTFETVLELDSENADALSFKEGDYSFAEIAR